MIISLRRGNKNANGNKLINLIYEIKSNNDIFFPISSCNSLRNDVGNVIYGKRLILISPFLNSHFAYVRSCIILLQDYLHDCIISDLLSNTSLST